MPVASATRAAPRAGALPQHRRAALPQRTGRFDRKPVGPTRINPRRRIVVRPRDRASGHESSQHTTCEQILDAATGAA